MDILTPSRRNRAPRGGRLLAALVISSCLAPMLSASPVRAAGPVEYWVATDGSDAAPGTQAKPFATLTRALARSVGGETIFVAPGAYPRASDTKARTSIVTVRGAGAATRVAGMTISGGQSLDISHLSFTGSVAMRWSASRFAKQPTAHVHIHDADITAPGSTCVAARDGASDIAITNVAIHDCANGFGAAAGGPILQSRGLSIEGSSVKDVTGDAIQLGQWSDVKIVDNTLSGMRDPKLTYHNDGVQFTGNVFGAQIIGNSITDSRTQLIFIQDAVGPIDDVLIADNIVDGAGAVAVQLRGATNVRFVENTVWGGKDGALWLAKGSVRSGHPTPTVTTDTVVVDNVLQDLRRLDNTSTSLSVGNVVPCAQGAPPSADAGAGTACLPDLGFVDDAAGDLRLSADSAARQLGASLGALADDLLGLDDADGLPRDAASTPIPGAYR